MFELSFEPHPSDPKLRKVFITPHPQTGWTRHVGYCGVKRSQGWGLLCDKALKLNEWQKQLVNDLLEQHFDRVERTSADAGSNSGG